MFRGFGLLFVALVLEQHLWVDVYPGGRFVFGGRRLLFVAALFGRDLRVDLQRERRELWLRRGLLLPARVRRRHVWNRFVQESVRDLSVRNGMLQRHLRLFGQHVQMRLAVTKDRSGPPIRRSEDRRST